MKKLALLLTLSALVGSAFAQTAVSSSVSLATNVDASYNDFQPSVQGSYTASQGNTLGTLSGVASSYYSKNGNIGEASTSVQATWLNAGKGSVHATGGWKFTTNDQGFGLLNGGVNGSKVWSYTFIATATSTLTLNYNVVGRGNTFGLHAYHFEFDGVGGGATLGPVWYYPDGSGVLTRSLVAGQTYTMSLRDSSNISAGINGYDASYDGQFDWNVQAVPEPFSMSALALGFAAVARRRRK